jgi:hypothetical protein
MATECDQPKLKIRRVEKKDNVSFYLLKSFVSEKILMNLLSALGRICLADINVIKLAPLKIINSNAAHCNGGVLFSKAFCELQFWEKRFSFGDIFRRGLDICLECVEGNLSNKSDHAVFDVLIQFLSEGMSIMIICQILIFGCQAVYHLL